MYLRRKTLRWRKSLLQRHTQTQKESKNIIITNQRHNASSPAPTPLPTETREGIDRHHLKKERKIWLVRRNITACAKCSWRRHTTQATNRNMISRIVYCGLRQPDLIPHQPFPHAETTADQAIHGFVLATVELGGYRRTNTANWPQKIMDTTQPASTATASSPSLSDRYRDIEISPYPAQTEQQYTHTRYREPRDQLALNMKN